MTKIEKQIAEFLNGKTLDYWTAVELYEQHPNARNNIKVNLQQRYRLGAMHEKIVHELETLIGAKPTFRSTVLGERPTVVPFKIVAEVKEIAPENYEYAVAFNDLPKELQYLVAEKGEHYKHLDIAKKALANLGEVNDIKTVAKRKALLKEMHDYAFRIKAIHAYLLAFDPEKGIDADGLTKLYAPPIEEDLDEEEIEEVIGEITEEFLEKKFQFGAMDYYQRKDMLVRLRSTVIKQRERAETSKKEETKQKNIKAAEISSAMIELLTKYFDETAEPTK